MGRKRTRKRQYFYCFAAVLLMFSVSACASVKTMFDEHASAAYLHDMQVLMDERDFTTVYWENQRILTHNPQRSPADAARFSQGLAYADPANPDHNHQLAKEQFRQLLYDFPYSRYAGEAQVWIRVLADEQWKIKEKQAYLQNIQQLINKNDFAQAEKLNLEQLEKTVDGTLKDAALLSLGRIYADPGNPQQDYQAAQKYFSRLATDFPYSTFADEGRFAGSFLKQWQDDLERSKYLQHIQSLIKRSDFESALRENRNQLAKTPKQPLADAALFSSGLIYLKPDNPKKDFSQARAHFSRLVREYPGSTFVEESKAILNLLELLEQAMQIDKDIDEKTKVLRQ